VKEYLAQEKEEIRLKREARKTGDFYVSAQPKVYFVVRLKGWVSLCLLCWRRSISKIAPKPKKILQLLRLLQINNGVFVRVTKATQQMLNLVNPYVTYGEPNLKAIRELVYRRGYAKVDGQRIPITDNSIIENQLGKYGIVCTYLFQYLDYADGHRHGGSGSWDRHMWPQLQTGDIVSLAVQAIEPKRWMAPEEVHRLCWGRRCGEQGEAHVEADPPDGVSGASCRFLCLYTIRHHASIGTPSIWEIHVFRYPVSPDQCALCPCTVAPQKWQNLWIHANVRL